MCTVICFCYVILYSCHTCAARLNSNCRLVAYKSWLRCLLADKYKSTDEIHIYDKLYTHVLHVDIYAPMENSSMDSRIEHLCVVFLWYLRFSLQRFFLFFFILHVFDFSWISLVLFWFSLKGFYSLVVVFFYSFFFLLIFFLAFFSFCFEVG